MLFQIKISFESDTRQELVETTNKLPIKIISEMFDSFLNCSWRYSSEQCPKSFVIKTKSYRHKVKLRHAQEGVESYLKDRDRIIEFDYAVLDQDQV